MGSADSATLPAAQCLTGTYTLVRFVALGGTDTYGTGQGGDVTVSFADGRYTLRGAGRKPVVLTLAGQQAELSVDGTVKGRFSLAGSAATFSTTSTKGSGRLVLGPRRQRLSIGDVAKVIGLKGHGQVACTQQAMTITLPRVRLEFGRV